MRKILCLSSFIFSSMVAYADISDCLKDAESHGSNQHAIKPNIKCADLINNSPNKVETQSVSGDLKVYGFNKMFYLEVVKDSKSIKVLQAGDQTELSHILKISLNEKKKRILVMQQDGENRGLLTFDKDLLGNVSPLRHFKSSLLNYANDIKLMNSREEIAILSPAKIVFMNADADDRFKGEKFTPRILRQIHGPKSQLDSPKDVVISNILKKIFVLDGKRILIFNLEGSEQTVPRQIITKETLSEATSIDLDESQTGLNIRNHSTIIDRLE
jgi:hypothetical protein